jgi:hypothetical protein
VRRQPSASRLRALEWSRRKTAGTSGPRLDLQPRFFEVEVTLDASSHLVADASFAPEPEELRALGAQQLLPETLVRQGAFLVSVDLFAALSLLAVACSVETPVWPSTRLSKVRTRTRPGDNHASVLPGENGPKYVDLRQPAISTSSVRGPCTPSTLSSSMSEVADGPEIKVMALPSPLTTLSRPTKASGTRPTICCSRTTHRW